MVRIADLMLDSQPRGAHGAEPDFVPRASPAALLVPAAFGLTWPPSPGMEAAAGRLHPMLVHFPIALLLAAALFEVLRWVLRREGPSPAARACLVLAAFGAAAAAGAGWLYAEHDPPGRSVAEALDLHRWGGVATAALSWVALILSAFCRVPRADAGEGDDDDDRRARGPITAYRLSLVVAAAAVGFTGHLGGELVYGEGFVLEPLQQHQEEPSAPPRGDVGASTHASASDTQTGAGLVDGADVTRAADPAPVIDDVDGTDATLADEIEFTRDVQPLFEARCFSCHGPRKQKGKLRLDVGADLFAGDPSTWVIVPGDAAASKVHELIVLPDWDPDRMPAEGESLTADEIALVTAWIDGGALWDGVAVPKPARDG